MYYTVLLGHQYLTWYLILKGVHDFNASDMYGKTALRLVICMSDLEATRMFLDRTVDVNARDSRGCTPLHYGVVR